jgi:hypothetical protein
MAESETKTGAGNTFTAAQEFNTDHPMWRSERRVGLASGKRYTVREDGAVSDRGGILARFADSASAIATLREVGFAPIGDGSNVFTAVPDAPVAEEKKPAGPSPEVLLDERKEARSHVKLAHDLCLDRQAEQCLTLCGLRLTELIGDGAKGKMWGELTGAK